MNRRQNIKVKDINAANLFELTVACDSAVINRWRHDHNLSYQESRKDGRFGEFAYVSMQIMVLQQKLWKKLASHNVKSITFQLDEALLVLIVNRWSDNVHREALYPFVSQIDPKI